MNQRNNSQTTTTIFNSVPIRIGGVRRKKCRRGVCKGIVVMGLANAPTTKIDGLKLLKKKLEAATTLPLSICITQEELQGKLELESYDKDPTDEKRRIYRYGVAGREITDNPVLNPKSHYSICRSTDSQERDNGNQQTKACPFKIGRMITNFKSFIRWLGENNELLALYTEKYKLQFNLDSFDSYLSSNTLGDGISRMSPLYLTTFAMVLAEEIEKRQPVTYCEVIKNCDFYTYFEEDMSKWSDEILPRVYYMTQAPRDKLLGLSRKSLEKMKGVALSSCVFPACKHQQAAAIALLKQYIDAVQGFSASPDFPCLKKNEVVTELGVLENKKKKFSESLLVCFDSVSQYSRKELQKLDC